MIIHAKTGLRILPVDLVLLRSYNHSICWEFGFHFCQASLIKLSSSFTLKLISAFNALYEKTRLFGPGCNSSVNDNL